MGCGGRRVLCYALRGAAQERRSAGAAPAGGLWERQRAAKPRAALAPGSRRGRARARAPGERADDGADGAAAGDLFEPPSAVEHRVEGLRLGDAQVGEVWRGWGGGRRAFRKRACLRVGLGGEHARTSAEVGTHKQLRQDRSPPDAGPPIRHARPTAWRRRRALPVPPRAPLATARALPAHPRRRCPSACRLCRCSRTRPFTC